MPYRWALQPQQAALPLRGRVVDCDTIAGAWELQLLKHTRAGRAPLPSRLVGERDQSPVRGSTGGYAKIRNAPPVDVT